MRKIRLFSWLLSSTLLCLSLAAGAQDHSQGHDHGGETQSSPAVPFEFAYSDGSVAKATWVQGPRLATGGESAIDIQFVSSDGALILTEAPPSLEVTMPSMNHPGVPTTVTATGPGQFRISEIYFTMEGGWRMTLTRANGEAAASSQDFEIGPLTAGDCN